MFEERRAVRGPFIAQFPHRSGILRGVDLTKSRAYPVTEPTGATQALPREVATG